MIKHDFPKNSFIGGWYIPEQVCDNLIKEFKLNREKVKHVTDERLDSGGDVAIYPGCVMTKGRVGKSNDINTNTKDSIDMGFDPGGKYYNTNKSLQEYDKYLQIVLDNYLKDYEYADEMTAFNIQEYINIQHYKPGGGFKIWHFENASPQTMSRKLVFMTYLNDVPNGGTEFYYQNVLSPAKKGLTIIWPADWTHTHRGQVDEENEKYICTGWYNYRPLKESNEFANQMWGNE